MRCHSADISFLSCPEIALVFGYEGEVAVSRYLGASAETGAQFCTLGCYSDGRGLLTDLLDTAKRKKVHDHSFEVISDQDTTQTMKRRCTRVHDSCQNTSRTASATRPFLTRPNKRADQHPPQPTKWPHLSNRRWCRGLQCRCCPDFPHGIVVPII